MCLPMLLLAFLIRTSTLTPPLHRFSQCSSPPHSFFFVCLALSAAVCCYTRGFFTFPLGSLQFVPLAQSHPLWKALSRFNIPLHCYFSRMVSSYDAYSTSHPLPSALLFGPLKPTVPPLPESCPLLKCLPFFKGASHPGFSLLFELQLNVESLKVSDSSFFSDPSSLSKDSDCCCR